MGVEGCSSTDERDPDTEDIQRCQLVTKHPRRNCNRRELLKIPAILIGTTPVRSMILQRYRDLSVNQSDKR
jgi:hypothetical protein